MLVRGFGTTVDLACKLTAPELRERRETVITALRAQVSSVAETGDGFLYTFPLTTHMVGQVASFIETERQCCEFFSFHLSITSGSTEMTLEISGPEGSKEFLRNELGF
jgi:hypothetical protein